ncbi:MAG: hypothetical protein ACTSUE_20430 [Promethearchaeota archaeon]
MTVFINDSLSVPISGRFSLVEVDEEIRYKFPEVEKERKAKKKRDKRQKKTDDANFKAFLSKGDVQLVTIPENHLKAMKTVTRMLDVIRSHKVEQRMGRAWRIQKRSENAKKRALTSAYYQRERLRKMIEMRLNSGTNK